MIYRNISGQWGDNVMVTVDDVKKQAVIFGLDPNLVSANNDGIYYNDELIAEPFMGEKKLVMASRTWTPEYGCDAHNVVVVTLSRDVATRILKLAEIVRRERVYAIEEFAYNFDVYERTPAGDFDVDTQDLRDITDDWDARVPEEPLRCDLCLQVITADGFRVQWQPKHADISGYCESETFELSHLRKFLGLENSNGGIE